MRTTFLIASNLGMTPFDVMAQDIDAVIMVVNYLIDSAGESESHQSEMSEKERDREIWSAL